MGSRIDAGRLTFTDFVDEGDREARLRWDWDAQTVVQRGSVADQCSVAWKCTGRQVRVHKTVTNTVIAQLFGSGQRALPGTRVELGLTYCGVQDLVALLTWLRTPNAHAA